MYDNDDIRYSRAEERPPWELSPAGRWRERHSCDQVEDTTAGYCREVEHQKQARIQAQARRSAAQSNMMHQREEAQQRLRREQEAARARMEAAHAATEQRRAQLDPSRPAAAPSHDDRAGRYIYTQPPAAQPTGRRAKPLSGGLVILITVVFLLLVIMMIGYLSDSSPSFTEAEEEDGYGLPFDPDDVLPDEDEPSGSNHGSVIPWRDLLPDEEDEQEQPTASTAETLIPRAELDTPLELEIRSSNGLEPLSYQALYEKCLPSTVSITVYADDGGGTGTGIIMTQDGYILTCDHMVQGGESCQVTTWDDQVYDALLVGSDPQTDLALLKIDASGLTPAEFGDSDALTVGDEALAIGDPLGTELRGTLTNGIISAINRNVVMHGYTMTLIQTTAALNSGNSGGPLINIYGQVVGVNNMKMNSSYVTVEGLGFAVPTRVVKDIVPILSAHGQVSRPVLGITCYGIDAEAAQRNDEPSQGLRVVSINPASDAGNRGLQVDDFIYSVNGTEVVSVSQVQALLKDAQIGDQVELLVRRFDEDGEMEELTITITLIDQADLQ